MFFNKKMSKFSYGLPYNSILLSKTEWIKTKKTSDTCNNMDEFQKHAKWKEARKKKRISCMIPFIGNPKPKLMHGNRTESGFVYVCVG